jgi:hypothetical protein
MPSVWLVPIQWVSHKASSINDTKTAQISRQRCQLPLPLSTIKMDSSFEIKRRLETLLPDAREIMKISCCPGAAIAVIHDGKLFHSKYIGYRDVENKVPIVFQQD